MKFLTETVENVQVDIQESSIPGVKDYFITGVFMQSGVKNKNGRIYPPDVLVGEMNRYITEQINTKRSVGELNHPNGPNINLDKVSHMITDLWVEGNNIYGKAKILNTPQGQIVKTLIDEGVQLGVSTRGFGSINEERGAKVVQKDFRLATIDIVQDPSCQSAYVSTLMESKEFFVDEGGNIRERDSLIIAENVDASSEESSDEISEDEILEKFETALNEISKNALVKYIKKSAGDLGVAAQLQGAHLEIHRNADNDHTAEWSRRNAEDFSRIRRKRQKWLSKAVDKLADDD